MRDVPLSFDRCGPRRRRTRTLQTQRNAIAALRHSQLVTCGVSDGGEGLGQWRCVRFCAAALFRATTDVVGLVAFLISDEADFITGQFIAADGGLTRL
jgi:NAD(P)-dependent dehydrogenase (short-subunit alcohol dehydrogenase family)